LHWSDSAIVGTLPSLQNRVLSVAKTQPATLTVTTQHGSVTSAPVTYRAPRVVVEYPFRRLIKEISQEANEDSCTATTGENYAWCYHARTHGHWDSMLKSKDTYTIDLKNGWTLDSWVFTNGAGCCVDLDANANSHAGQGQAHVTYALHWFLPCNIGCYLY